MRTFLFAVVAVAVILCFSQSAEANDVPISSSIKLEGHLITFEISVSEEISILPWGTPFDGSFQERFLAISAVEEENHRQWTFLAPTVKRIAPSKEHFVTLSSGRSVSGTIDVRDHFEVHAVGAYLLRLDFPVVLEDGTRTRSVSNEVVMEVTSAVERRSPAMQRSVDSVFFESCSSSQIDIINAAIPDAISSVADALEYFDANGSCIDDYEEWLGAFSPNRFSVVDDAFESILSQFQSNDFGFDCSCTDIFTFAFVFSNDPAFTINLCGAFWDAPSGRNNIDSQPGTLVHEMSHFEAVYGTSDFAYGVFDVRTLADTNPSDAINNADSLEYFTESSPVCNNVCGDDSCTGVENETCARDCGGSASNSPGSPVSTNNSPDSPDSPNSPNSPSSNNSPGGAGSSATALAAPAMLAVTLSLAMAF